MDLIDIFNTHSINYSSIKNNSLFKIVNNADVDVSIIIPVKGRTNFNHVLFEHLTRAANFCKNKTFAITFVEHSQNKEHENLCANKSNYIWINTTDTKFNKCLAFNIGFLYSNRAKFYLFHDLDIMMDERFFVELFANYERVKHAVQSFKNKRVLYCNPTLTDNIIHKNVSVNQIKTNTHGITVGREGAPGGSIFVSREQFINVGGYDPEYFYGYSIEDQFFYDKLQLFGGITGAIDPEIEVFHLNHPPAYHTNPDERMHHTIYRVFKDSSMEFKTKLINLKKQHFQNYVS